MCKSSDVRIDDWEHIGSIFSQEFRSLNDNYLYFILFLRPIFVICLFSEIFAYNDSDKISNVVHLQHNKVESLLSSDRTPSWGLGGISSKVCVDTFVIV